jgi:histone-lysine N-methyltransferase SUV39H
VIPSPTSKQRRDIAIAKRKTNVNGMDDEIFPTTEENERIAKAAYPIARNRVDRRSVPLSFRSPSDHDLTPKLKGLLAQLKHTINAKLKRDHLTKLNHTLNEKLRRIAGPAVTANIDCPKLLARLADNFEFVNSYLYRAGVERIPDDSEFNIGCACNGNANGCDPHDCDCLSKEEDSENRIVPYQISESNPKLIVATKKFLKRKAIIYECNSRCGCNGDRCWNHVVQKGRTVKFEIFDTGPRGFGMFKFTLVTWLY